MGLCVLRSVGARKALLVVAGVAWLAACGSDDEAGSAGATASSASAGNSATGSGGATTAGSSESGSTGGSGGSTASNGDGEGVSSGGGTSSGGNASTGTGGESGAGAEPGLPPGAPGMPAGIPSPEFACEAEDEPDELEPSYFVDNTNPDCNDEVGSESEPFCDPFRGGSTVSFAAGDVVLVRGGPYTIQGDYTLTAAGTSEAPVVLRGSEEARVVLDGEGQRANFTWAGSYLRIENLAFRHMTRHSIDADYAVFRNVAVTNPENAVIDFNPVVNVRGHDVVVCRSEIGNNRRADDTDAHGIQTGEGSYNVWILDNEIYNNNGDAFQGCHECFDAPPHHVYIGRNVMHDDRENGIDLKTIHDVVVSENLLYGYAATDTSGGDAMVIGSNGFDEQSNQGPRRVWVINNEFRQSERGLRIEGSQNVWVLGNVMNEVAQGVQIDDKPHSSIVIANNTILGTAVGVRAWGCQPTALDLWNNIVEASERHVDWTDCNASTVTVRNNLLFPGDLLSVRIGSTNYTSPLDLEQLEGASGNLTDDPLFESGALTPSAESPAVDAGVDLALLHELFETEWGASIAVDRSGTARPAGAAVDIGAYERP